MTQPEAARVERGPITEVKRFALGMADLLERQGFTVAAAELRRLHAENEKFRKHIESQNKELDELIPMAERLEAQRDALLEALRLIAGLISHPEARQKALDAITKCGENT